MKNEEPFVMLAEKLIEIGWKPTCDAQWIKLRESIPQLRSMLTEAHPQVRYTSDASDNVASISFAGSHQLAIVLEAIGDSLRISSLNPGMGTEAFHACRCHSPTLKALANGLRLPR